MAIEDLTLYQGGALAGRLLQSEDGQSYLGGALEQIASDLGLEESAMGFINGSMASEDGIKVAVGTYNKKYEDALGELSVKDFYEFYRDGFEKGLNDEEKETLRKKYDSNKSNIKDVKGKIAKLQHQMKSPDEKEREAATKEMEKYSDIMNLLVINQDILYMNLLPKAIEKTNMRRIKELAQAA